GACWQPAHCQPDKTQYELQERCAKFAAQTFEKDWGSNVQKTKDGETVATYENHYNQRLNKCFYLLRTTTLRHEKNDVGVTMGLVLVDLNDHKEIATFSEWGNHTATCIVQDTQCNSEKEWRRLARPYLEE